eukprot:TRINITY_DN5811_c0_g1_i1.p1 TRINITY_DN5811_c0_g1~~TRINITY_DN5811_c0_g1_i1.p1  ORF type:complete len:455 (+),score=63.19 TRINITY_DN5811_c0_g1_i1:28-1365(+)
MCPIISQDSTHHTFSVVNKTPRVGDLKPQGKTKKPSEMFFDEAGWPDHTGETFYEWLRHKIFVCWLLLKWAAQLIITAGPMRLVRWLWLLGRIITFVALLLIQVFLPMTWHYCTSGSILRDVPYNKDKESQGRSVLDIYLPGPAYSYIARHHNNRKQEQKHPVAIFLVGGAWIVGYKGWGALLARLLSAAGVVCFLPDYRNFPQATISDMISDTDDAVAWVLANLEVYGGDPDNVVLIGQSAGAHLGITALLGQCISPTKWSPSSISAFVGISGPYDILGLADFFETRGLYKYVVKLIFEGSFEEYSPVSMLDTRLKSLPPDFPPTYLFHGTEDNTVPSWSSCRLAAELEARDVKVCCKLLKGHTHTAPIIESPVGGHDPLMADLLCLFFSEKGSGKLPPTEGFTGNMTEVMENRSGAEKLAKVSQLVPQASDILLSLAKVANPF